MSLLDDEDLNPRDSHRELTLSTGSILGIFFAIVLSWGLFFGLGYNMGGKKSPTPETATADTSSPSANFSSFKPAAGSPAGTTPVSPTPSTTATYPPHASQPAAPPPQAADPEAAPIVRAAPVAPTHTTVTPATPAATGSFIVQVAAVSHQEDADLLVNALRGKGYAVTPRSEPQDKLVHIQVGPFTNRKDAETMRQRLLTDGYNALIK